ncbi:hypothetical protein ABMA70_00815 [Halobacteriovorax sp. XZX-3]|uniref:hypothetical protein n=1 Tax=unclassified Halobacteriovorax TaxID=2639665 RepID=UPI000CD2DEB7|nr:hypothetical protein [Halobacteriovorax sp. DA5]POB14307.1 hypothetical protein C0Z22_04245 [Halobacteriovorax sp. DA5]
MRKFLIFCSISLAALFIISSYQNDAKTISKEYSPTDSMKKTRFKARKHHHGHSDHSRKIASIPSTATPNTEVSESDSLAEVAKELTKEDIAVIKKVKKNLPILADSEFEIVKRLKITDKSIYIVNRDVNGMPQSFTAIIDNKTGRIEKSWGKTRYESPLSTRHYPATTY